MVLSRVTPTLASDRVKPRGDWIVTPNLVELGVSGVKALGPCHPVGTRVTSVTPTAGVALGDCVQLPFVRVTLRLRTLVGSGRAKATLGLSSVARPERLLNVLSLTPIVLAIVPTLFVAEHSLLLVFSGQNETRLEKVHQPGTEVW